MHSVSEFLRFFTGKKSDVCSVHMYNYNARTIRMLREKKNTCASCIVELYRTQFDQSQCLLDPGYFIKTYKYMFGSISHGLAPERGLRPDKFINLATLGPSALASRGITKVDPKAKDVTVTIENKRGCN